MIVGHKLYNWNRRRPNRRVLDLSPIEAPGSSTRSRSRRANRKKRKQRRIHRPIDGVYSLSIPPPFSLHLFIRVTGAAALEGQSFPGASGHDGKRSPPVCVCETTEMYHSGCQSPVPFVKKALRYLHHPEAHCSPLKITLSHHHKGASIVHCLIYQNNLCYIQIKMSSTSFVTQRTVRKNLWSSTPRFPQDRPPR